MTYIVVSGIDGSGKTSVIKALKNQLEKEGKEVHYIWMRYNHYLVKILNAVARLLGYSVKTNTKIGNIWQHHYYKSTCFFRIYTFCSYIDNWIGSIKVRRIPTSKYDFVIIDRWINDVLIDLGSEAHRIDFLNSKWYNRFQKIIPPNTLKFVIIRNVEEIIQCRPESQIDPNFPYRLELYNELKNKKEIAVIENSSTIFNCTQQILKYL